MPHVFQPSEPERFRVDLSGRGIESILAFAALGLGLIAFVATFFPGGYVVASWAGTLGFGVGLYSQYISESTFQRSLNVVGMVASFIGVALGIARGGFLP
ncbi:hypothetical protein [Nonomuraea sp. NPDC050310]|uniref:hypothetical protein n=1 Tax=unclassified Nonomuraea TaxID=2593643 RepID=UPI003409B293